MFASVCPWTPLLVPRAKPTRASSKFLATPSWGASRRASAMCKGDVFQASSMPDRNWWSALWPHPEQVLRALGIKPGMTVVDLCCGDGYFTAPLAKIVGGKVYALDLDCAMIERAKAEVAEQGASVRQWICADAMALASHVTELVDYVLIANTFH